jgi:hypothetical protein
LIVGREGRDGDADWGIKFARYAAGTWGLLVRHVC